ncbi:putative RING-H2 finger protein ATL21A [Coffea eugenioides]|uniref:putative RING-H2 finger protein ATL21A n=1 Tax=Coffea eugenioides TaxID=49369 RepID=UPI000F60D801|nr:putative RING-H2 finger protein ATL21A [Coffea eugenioides]
MGSSGAGVGLSSFSSSSSSFCLLIFFFLPHLSLSVRICKPASCSEMGLGPPVRFPFRLKGIQDQNCGYPGFDLSCNNHSQTILSLPRSGEFRVNWINYSEQTIYINDPGDCLPRRVSNFSAVDSSFRAAPNSYTYFNCSLEWAAYRTTDNLMPLFCYGDYNSTIVATPSRYSSEIPPSCRLIRNASIPLRLSYAEFWSETIVEEDLELVWDQPAGCRSCEKRGLYCGFKSNSGLEIGCGRLPRKGLRRGAMYGIIIGVGIPVLVCLVGLACYACNKVRDFGQRRSLNTELSTAGTSLPPASVTVTGLDAPTIESYPKTVVGESRRLPNPSDGTCPICLAEYQPKETLRSIPECNHYFHASCVDEWLKLNGTCPLCRNSPESASTTPCSSTPSTFSASSSA